MFGILHYREFNKLCNGNPRNMEEKMRLKRTIRRFRGLLILCFAVFLLLLIHKNYYSSPLDDIYLSRGEPNAVSFTANERIPLKPKFYSSDANNIKIRERPTIIIEDKWIHIDKDISIFSAYWESRIKPSFVRIIGIGSDIGNDLSHINCALRYNQRNVTTIATSNRIPENHGFRHTAMFYLCHTDKPPLEVALFVKNQTDFKWLKVKNIEPNGMSRKKLALCIQPLYGSFPNNNLQIAEFISYYQLLNATHFVFYNYKADTSVISFLSELSKSGISIEYLKWNVPAPVEDAWNFAQLASIVDCMYRQSHSHEYVFTVDLDEFLVPYANLTLQDLIESLDSEGKWCSYMFRQSFFCLQLPDNPDSVSTDINLFTVKKVLRAKRVWAAYTRSKTIVRPVCTQVPGIHFVWSTIQSSNNIMVVNPDIGLLHHYRGGISDEECNDNIMDKSAVKFGQLIINSGPINVWKRWNKSSYHIH